MVTDDELLEYANYILNHDAKEQVLRSISEKLLGRFRAGTEAERSVVSNMMDSVDMFFDELNTIVATLTKSDPEDEKPEDINR